MEACGLFQVKTDCVFLTEILGNKVEKEVLFFGIDFGQRTRFAQLNPSIRENNDKAFCVQGEHISVLTGKCSPGRT